MRLFLILTKKHRPVFQTEPVDRGEYIEIGVEVRDLPPQEGGEHIEGM